MIDWNHLPADAALDAALESLKNRETPRRILMGDVAYLGMIEEQMASETRTPDGILDAAKPEIIAPWTDHAAEKEFIDEALGNWPEDVDPSHGFSLPFDDEGQPLAEVIVAEFPCKESWQAPAHIGFGNWNDCPAAEVHCAIWRRWQERFEAHIVGLSATVIEARVLRPPATQREALELAMEQTCYCPELVMHHTGTVEALAALLLEGESWFFGWS